MAEEEEKKKGWRRRKKWEGGLFQDPSALVSTWSTWKEKIPGDRGDWTVIPVSCHMDKKVQKYNEEKNAGQAPSHVREQTRLASITLKPGPWHPIASPLWVGKRNLHSPNRCLILSLSIKSRHLLLGFFNGPEPGGTESTIRK